MRLTKNKNRKQGRKEEERKMERDKREDEIDIKCRGSEMCIEHTKRERKGERKKSREE